MHISKIHVQYFSLKCIIYVTCTLFRSVQVVFFLIMLWLVRDGLVAYSYLMLLAGWMCEMR